MTAASMIAALALAQATAPASAPVPSQPPAVQLGTRYPVLTLAQALKDARLQNLDIQQAEARLQQARQLSWKAWSFYLPQVTASGTYTRNNIGAAISLPTGYNVVDTGQLGPPPPQGTATTFVTGTPTGFQTAEIQTRDQLGAQAQVSQALLAPALWPAIANAYTAEKVVELNVENARREVLFGVAAAYYGAAGLKQAMEVTERQLVIAREHERDARVRYDAGTSPKVALLRAEIDRAQAEQDLKRAQNAFLQAKQALATALDRQPDFDVEPPPSPQVPKVEDPEQMALRDRPDVLAAQKSLVLAEGQRDAIYYQYAPSIGAFAWYRWTNVTGFTGSETAWALGLALTWNVFDGGLREAQLRENRARVVEADAARRASEARAVDEVRRSQLDLDSAFANREKAKEKVALARETNSLTEINYKAGAATYLETTDALESLRSAELGLVAESLNADLAALRLLKAMGAFREVNQ
jgi:outer membrane protein TolC